MSSPVPDLQAPADDFGQSVPVVVVIERRPAVSRWQSHSWRLSKVLIVSTNATAVDATTTRDLDGIHVRHGDNADEFIWGGLQVQLHKDEAESYYHNLVAPKPSLYVVTRIDEQGRMAPFTVTASFDEAHAYMEGDEDAHAVPLPDELYARIERFVLTHYVPEKRKKRKRENWKDAADPRGRNP